MPIHICKIKTNQKGRGNLGVLNIIFIPLYFDVSVLEI